MRLGNMGIGLRNFSLMGIFVPGFIACASPATSAPPAPTAGTTPADDTPSASGHGEFLSRVLPTGEVAKIDPILVPGCIDPPDDPGCGVASHTHMFFGAENVMSTSTRSQLEAQPTSAQNENDTAAYWVPELLFEGDRQMPGCTGSPPNLTCGTHPDTTLHLRVYYTTTDPANTIQMPPVMMVTGYPVATEDPHLSDPTSLMRVSYDCGADPAAHMVTPVSQWPYTCTPYFQGSGTVFDGVVMIVDFPECWNGNVSGTMNGERMVRYIDPNVPSDTCPNGGVCNDLAYANEDGSCQAPYSYRIPRVSIHVHSKIMDPSSDGTQIDPSSCSAQKGFTNTCLTQLEPTNVGLGLSSDAAPHGGWYTLHADFVQSWHMGTVTHPFGHQPPPDQDTQGEQPCTLNDLTEDCLIAGQTCGLQPQPRSGCVAN